MKIKHLLFAVFAVALVGCASSKQSGPDTEIEVPCSGYGYSNDSQSFRASAMGLSTNMEIANQKAMAAARQKIATSVQVTVKTVTDNYLSSHEVGLSEEARGRFQSISRGVASQTLNNVRVICNKTTQNSEGQYKSYVALEIGAEDLGKDISKGISDDEKLRTDFEYEQYKKVFDAEMQKLENER